MSEWLDTETKAILQGAPPDKIAPPGVAGYTLVLLSKSNHQERLRLALAKAGCSDPASLDAVLGRPCPHAVAAGMTVEEAMFGQFELACCDSAAVFLRDEIVAENDHAYLADLYEQLLASDEFRPVEIEIHSTPRNDQGRRYVRQFLGTDESFLEWVQLLPSQLFPCPFIPLPLIHWRSVS